MEFARRRSNFLRLFTTLGIAAAVALAARARGAEIAGIDRVYLRDGAGSERTALGVLDSGAQVEVLGTEGSWTKVKTQDGKVGFVYGRYVQAQTAAESSTGQAPEARASDASPLAATETPTTETGGAVAPTPAEVGATQEIFAEIATLRGEVADLRQKVQARSPEPYAAHATEGVTGGPPAAPAGGSLAFGGARSTRDQNAGVLVIALLSLLVGWVLGSAFTKRRTRSQRPRLRL